MQLQQIQCTMNITPATMDQVLQRILDILTDPAVALLEMSNLVKSLFYGLWNFDKMLNQHRLSTRISELLIKTPKQSAKALLRGLFAYLSEKWNLIDHHRINKFMQLVKYLLKHAVGMCQLHRLSISKLDTILLETVFKDAETKSGLAYHIIDVYYNTLLENSQQCQTNGVTIQDLSLPEKLLTRHRLEHFRLHIIEQVYEKFKGNLWAKDSESKDLKIQEASSHFMELAKGEGNDLIRKNLYALIGFLKSETLSFRNYLEEKEAKAAQEKQKRKKKISKAKKVLISEAKSKRKEKNKLTKKSKILSKRKFEARKSLTNNSEVF